LDELRDKVHEVLDSKLKTAIWSVKRDAFLKKLPRLIKKLPQPEKVERSLLQEAEGKYSASLEEIAAKEEEIEDLKSQIGDLEKCKDQAQVRKVRAKHSSLENQFEELCESAGKALRNIELASSDLLFNERGGPGQPVIDTDWYESANRAASNQEISTDDGYSVCMDHPRVRKADAVLDALQSFIDRLPDGRFQEDFEDEHDFPLSLSNKEFWQFLR
jgi:hypothetical protein